MMWLAPPFHRGDLVAQGSSWLWVLTWMNRHASS